MATAKRTFHLSASAISAFKACPTRFRYGYVEGIRAAEDTETLRMGTNWHSLQEVYRNAINEWVKNHLWLQETDATAESMHSFAFDAAIRHLNESYAICPDGVSLTDWAIERTILAVSFAGYLWFYSNDKIETLCTEIQFKLPLHHPKTGMPLPVTDVVRVGKIDRIIRWQNLICNGEYKSTSKPIDPSSSYWAHLNMDSQVSIYAQATRDLQATGQLPGVSADETIAGTLYDVWHKPQISPSMLTQGDSKAVVETGKYLETDFKITTEADAEGVICAVLVDGEPADFKPGAKPGTFAVRETPEMFGARLLADIYERPEFYFQRKEITRTDAQLRAFKVELYNIYQSMKAMTESGHFFHNEQQCEASFKCPYIPICYPQLDVLNGQTPPGFKRIFTDLTVGVT